MPVQREESVRAHDVADVAEVAHRIERADADLVLLLALGGRDAVRERGNEEAVGLAGTGVRERAHAYDVEPVREVRLQARGTTPRSCSRRTGVDGRSGASSRSGRSRSSTCPYSSALPITIDAAHARGARGVEHVRGPFDVDAQHGGRIVPRLADVRERREVVHDLGPVAGERRRGSLRGR